VGLKLTADDDQQLRTLTEQYERRLWVKQVGNDWVYH
jgi:hypothetical protein